MSIPLQLRGIYLVGFAVLFFVATRCGAAESEATLKLSDDDRAWLAAHPVIRVGYDPDYRPFCFRDSNGNFSGIDADMLKVVAAQLGVRFEFVTDRNWSEVYARGERRDVDMLTSTTITPEREQLFLFTRDYVNFPVTIITGRDGPFTVTVSDLKTMRVAAVPDYAPTILLKRAYPEMQLRLAASMDKALLMVSQGEADAAVTNLVNASYIIKTHGLANLKIAGVIPQTFETRFAVRSDWPEWRDLLDRALTAMPPQETARIFDPWVRVDYAAVVRWDLVRRWAVIGIIFALTVIGLIVWRNASLQRELVRRRSVQDALEKTNVALKREQEEKTHLLHVAAHDLRNPLMGIVLGTDLLRAQRPPESTRTVIEQMGKSVRKMMRLVDDVLAVEVLETGARDFVIEPVDVTAVVREAISSHHAAAERKHITLDADFPAMTPRAAADADGLLQALDNLVSNALKFSPTDSRVEIAITSVADRIRIEIRDEGPGVPETERERIFAKFVRGSASPTGGEKSTGLGLAIVRELVAAMNGRVWCEPNPHGGTIFVVLLPQHRQPSHV